MIRRNLRLSALALSGLAIAFAHAAPLAAQDKGAAPGPYRIDPAHSSVEFSIRHLVSRVPGRFQTFTGEIAFDPANVKATSVQVEIDAASIYTNQEKRDGHLRSADFFDVGKFPKITFKSTSVTPVDASHAKLTGDLTMKGITKPVTLDVELFGVAKGMAGETRAGFQARGRIDRTAYDVVWNKAMEGGGTLLGNDVDLTLNVEAVKPSPQAPAKN